MATKEPRRVAKPKSSTAATSANGTTPGAVAATLAPSATIDPEMLLKRAAAAERRLVERERKAERALEAVRERLADADTKLGKARERVIRRQAEVDEAVAILRERQRSRAEGPLSATDGQTSAVGETEAVAPAAADETPPEATEPKPAAAATKSSDRTKKPPATDGAKPAPRRRKTRAAAS